MSVQESDNQLARGDSTHNIKYNEVRTGSVQRASRNTLASFEFDMMSEFGYFWRQQSAAEMVTLLKKLSAALVSDRHVSHTPCGPHSF